MSGEKVARVVLTVELEVIVPPLERVVAVGIDEVFCELRVREIGDIGAEPRPELGVAVFVVQEPARMGLIELLVAVAEHGQPQRRLEPLGANLIGNPFHAVGKFFIRLGPVASDRAALLAVAADLPACIDQAVIEPEGYIVAGDSFGIAQDVFFFHVREIVVPRAPADGHFRPLLLVERRVEGQAFRVDAFDELEPAHGRHIERAARGDSET